MNRKTVRQCLDENLSGLYVTERKHRMMMNDIMTGVKQMKKKISVATVLLAILLITAVTATAAALLNSLFAKTIDMEVEHGPLYTWSLEEKLELIDLLSVNGWSFSAEDIGNLHDEQITEAEKE